MHKKSGIALILAGLLAGCANQPGGLQGETLDLGDSQRVSRLFAYPNNCSVICYRDWTLEQTVEHYLQQSLTRDGYPQANVRVTRNGEHIHANFDGTPTDYGKSLLQLLDAGDLAYQGASQLNSDGKWQYNWYFFLPLGMALENRKSVELLHFPPDYSLTQAQDYLRSSTTDRWASLLSFNGVQPEHTPAYQTIIDIAPIAAPASAGSALEGVYGYFTSYQRRMVSELSVGSGASSLPVDAYGRRWCAGAQLDHAAIRGESAGAGPRPDRCSTWAAGLSARRQPSQLHLECGRPGQQQGQRGRRQRSRDQGHGAGPERRLLASRYGPATDS